LQMRLRWHSLQLFKIHLQRPCGARVSSQTAGGTVSDASTLEKGGARLVVCT
jgi:hypothetical protein